MDLQLQKFSEIDLTDTFFDSLKASYPEFDSWFKKKSETGATTYTYYIDGALMDFLYESRR